MRTLSIVAAGAVLLGAAALAEAQSFKPSKQQQVELGQRAAKDVREKERILPSYDSRVQLLRRVGNRLVGHMGASKDPWQFSFDVVDNKQINAFALPGGPVFFYSGLIDRLETEDQLAGVLAHEIAHVTEEHWAQNYAKAQQRGLLLAILLGATRANRTWQTVAGLVDVQQYTQYSRAAETDADDEAFDAVTQAGYNPAGLVDVFRMFERAKRGGVSLPWLATHPADSSRIQRIENRVQASQQAFPPQRALRYD